MTSTTALRLALGFVILVGAGCAAKGDKKPQAKANDQPQASADLKPIVNNRPKQPLMNQRDDWKNVPKDDGPPPLAKIEGVKTQECLLKAVDAERSAITVELGGQEFTLSVDPTATIEDATLRSFPVPGGLSGLQPGSKLRVTTCKKDDRDVVCQIKLKPAE